MTHMTNWAMLLDRAAKDESLERARKLLIQAARQAAAWPIVRRAHKLEEVGQNRTWLDGRSKVLEPEIKETFALAMSDHAASSTVAEELPLLATAYRLTGDALFRDRVVAQLVEMASWSPLQRPGWTLYAPGHRLPPDGKDGNWLATGCGVRAIGNTLEIMPEEAIDLSLRARLLELLEKEIASIVDDWQTKRPWFVRSNNPITNQWVLPTEGLIRACLITGLEKHREAYELGVRNMLQSLDAHGDHGEFEEGISYATFTVTSMVHAARAMAAAGDQRLLSHPFLVRFPTWMVHHLQPGRKLINAFDSGMFEVPRTGAADGSFVKLLCLLAACTGSPTARWALADQFAEPSTDVAGLVYRTLPPVGPEAAPSLYAYYERATRVNWRDSWADDATGVWVRGGHALDQHDHQDRGHVNLIVRGKPVLIEAGTPSYDHPQMLSHFTSGMGHNVLQIGTASPEPPYPVDDYLRLPGWQDPHALAPITVQRLDAAGGDVQVDVKSGYAGLEHWSRHVTWTSAELIVEDEVLLAGNGQDILIFRWHLGTPATASIMGEGTRYVVKSAHAEITLEGMVPLTVATTKLPDNSLGMSDSLHTCIVVQTRDAVHKLKLVTQVKPTL